MGLIQIQFDKNKTKLLSKSIFGKNKILNQINEVNNHYEIVKKFFPLFNENIKYDNFNVFPYFNNNFKLNGIGKNIKIICNDINDNDKCDFNNNDLHSQKLIYNDFLNLFNNNIPYGIFFIYEINYILYMIATTYNNKIVIINKSNSLEKLFNENVKGKNIFNFQPLSEQGIKYMYYNDEITGVVNGIGKIWKGS
jgi:hypothetical protein